MAAGAGSPSSGHTLYTARMAGISSRLARASKRGPTGLARNSFETRTTMNRFAITLASATALAAALIAAAPIGAHAASDAEGTVILDGIASHGAVVCNPNWLDRPGAYAILDAAKTAHASGLGDAAIRTLIKRGMNDFDGHVKSMGKVAACKQLNSMFVEMGG